MTLLQKRWSAKYPESIGAEVIARWQEPQRFYHDIRHLQSVLTHLDWAKGALEKSDALAGLSPAEKGKLFEKAELALWYHDVVYDPKAKDNEEQSAEVFKKHAAALKLDPQTAEEIYNLVLITKTHGAAKTLAEKIVVDCDLASLGADEKIFKENSADIRREYAHVPVALFETGRKNFLRGLLGSGPIYKTAPFQEKFEAAAKKNLENATASPLISPLRKILKRFM